MNYRALWPYNVLPTYFGARPDEYIARSEWFFFGSPFSTAKIVGRPFLELVSLKERLIIIDKVVQENAKC